MRREKELWLKQLHDAHAKKCKGLSKKEKKAVCKDCEAKGKEE